MQQGDVNIHHKDCKHCGFKTVVNAMNIMLVINAMIAWRDNKFVASNKGDYPVMCGVCRRLLDFDEYTSGACPNCHHGFNPRCKLHYEIYFED